MTGCFPKITGPVSTVCELRVSPINGCSASANRVNGEEILSVLGSEARVTRFSSARVQNGMEIRFRIATADGITELLSRFPWTLSRYEAALFLRAAMQRHGAVAA